MSARFSSDNNNIQPYLFEPIYSGDELQTIANRNEEPPEPEDRMQNIATW